MVASSPCLRDEEEEDFIFLVCAAVEMSEI